MSPRTRICAFLLCFMFILSCTCVEASMKRRRKTVPNPYDVKHSQLTPDYSWMDPRLRHIQESCSLHSDCVSCYSDPACWWSTPITEYYFSPPTPSCLAWTLMNETAAGSSSVRRQLSQSCDISLVLVSPTSPKQLFPNFFNLSVSFQSKNLRSIGMKLRLPLPGKPRNDDVTANLTFPVVDGLNEISFYPLNPENTSLPSIDAFINLIVPHAEFGLHDANLLISPALRIISSPVFQLTTCVSHDCTTCMGFNQLENRMAHIPFAFDFEPNRCLYLEDEKRCIPNWLRTRLPLVGPMIHSISECATISVDGGGGLPFYSSEELRFRYSLAGDMDEIAVVLTPENTPLNTTFPSSDDLNYVPTTGLKLISSSDLRTPARISYAPSVTPSNPKLVPTRSGQYVMSFRIPTNVVSGAFVIHLRGIAQRDWIQQVRDSGSRFRSVVSLPFKIIQGNKQPPPTPPEVKHQTASSTVGARAPGYLIDDENSQFRKDAADYAKYRQADSILIRFGIVYLLICLFAAIAWCAYVHRTRLLLWIANRHRSKESTPSTELRGLTPLLSQPTTQPNSSAAQPSPSSGLPQVRRAHNVTFTKTKEEPLHASSDIEIGSAEYHSLPDPDGLQQLAINRLRMDALTDNLDVKESFRLVYNNED